MTMSSRQPRRGVSGDGICEDRSQPVTRDLTLAFTLSLLVAALVAVVSAAGLGGAELRSVRYASCGPRQLAFPTMPSEAPTSVIVRHSADAGVATVIVPPSGVDLEAVERALIIFALESAAGNRTRAAKLVRLTRSALLDRMHKYKSIGGKGSSDGSR